VDPKTLVFLCHHLQEAFGHIFDECSTKKKHYLHFQILCHQQCSYLLVEKNHQLAQLHLHPSDPVAEQVFKVLYDQHGTELKSNIKMLQLSF